MGTTPTPSAAAQLKREQILRGAIAIFLRHGYEGTSMDQVATAAGVSKITIYKHFQDKQGLFIALMEQVTTQRFEAVFGTLSLEEEPAVVLRQVATKLLNLLAVDGEYIAFLRLIIGESGRFPALGQLFVQAMPQRVLPLLSQYFVAHPELDLAHPEAAARVFMGSLMGYTMTQYLLHGQALMPLAPEAMIDGLIDIIVRPSGQR